ncbi:MAG: VIT1/CCC1 transporter family protein [Actinobacteria bacterium]|nr:VIT1/CCC1 transporter family protein [Actinomycetota bacterium]
MFVADANDGIIATAGVIEGLLGSGVGVDAVLVAGLAAMITGGISMGSVRFSEAAAERDAVLELIEAERRRLGNSPTKELAELTDHYRAKGLSEQLARRVAEELTAKDAVAAHAQIDHGVDVDAPLTRPLLVASTAAIAFAIGAAVVVVASIFAPAPWRVRSTMVAVVCSLSVTSFIAGRWGQVPYGRTLARTVGIGLVAMLVTYAVGSLLPV